MEFLILIVAVIAVLGWFIWKDRKFEDTSSHPLDGATKAPTAPTSVLDVNQDGKVDLKDAVAAVEVVAEKTKKVAKKTTAKAKEVKEKAKTAVKKATAKKPKSK